MILRLALSLIVAVAMPWPGLSEASDFEAIKPSVVCIFSKGQDGPRRVGTGFIVQVEGDSAIIVTASHVVEGDGEPQLEFFNARNNRMKAQVGQREPDDPRGLAFLVVRDGLISSKKLKPLPFDLDDEVKSGTEVFLIGFGEGQGDWAVLRASVASQEGRDLRLDGRVEPGNSGGLVLRNGRVVGMVTQTLMNFGIAAPALLVNLTLKGWGVNVTRATAAPANRDEPPISPAPPRRADPAPNPTPPRPAVITLSGQYGGRSVSQAADGEQYFCDMAAVFSQAGTNVQATFQNTCGDYGNMQGMLAGALFNGQLNSVSVGYCEVAAQAQQGGAVLSGSFQCLGLYGTFTLARYQ